MNNNFFEGTWTVMFFDKGWNSPIIVRFHMDLSEHGDARIMTFSPGKLHEPAHWILDVTMPAEPNIP